MKAKTHEDQRRHVVEAAASVIRQFGFEKTTMNDIARALHMGKSSLYHYFATKELIFVEVIRNEIEELRTEFMSAIDEAKTPEEKIRAYVLKRTELLGRKLREHMGFLEATVERYDLLLKIHEIYDRDEIRIISSILTQGIAEGHFAVEEVKATSIAMVTAFRAFEYPFFPAAHPEKAMESLLDVLFLGILKR
jgi:AcrR family transcriptional regulator